MSFSISDLVGSKTPQKGGKGLKCSFCGKGDEIVAKLIAGPGVYICDECVDLCIEILNEENLSTNNLNAELGSGDPVKTWKGMEIVNDAEMITLAKSAAKGLEDLLNYIKEKEICEYNEPVLKAIIYLISRTDGVNASQLAPYLSSITEHYAFRNDYASAIDFLEWKLNLMEEQKDMDSKEIRETRKALVKCLIRCGRTDEAEKIIDQLD